jgi:signal transduction histidine kinase
MSKIKLILAILSFLKEVIINNEDVRAEVRDNKSTVAVFALMIVMTVISLNLLNKNKALDVQIKELRLKEGSMQEEKKRSDEFAESVKQTTQRLHQQELEILRNEIARLEERPCVPTKATRK